MTQTALHAHLAAAGAVFADDRGIALPRHFGDPAAEYEALVRGAAIVDLGFRTILRAVGEDRVTFLQGMLTNDVQSLAAGQGCPALLLTIQGRVTADVRVAADDDALVLDLDARVREAFVAALDALIIADDVELQPPTAPIAMIAVDGPRAAALVGADLEPFAHRPADVGGVPVRVVRASEVRGAGVLLHVPAAQAPQVWDALVAAGARPCGMEALEGRRVEVGVPRIDVDMGAKTLSLELPVDDAVNMRKGCYLGQEVVARGTARGHVNRRLCPVLLDRAAAPGATLTHDGKDVGHLTTVATAFGAGTIAALAFVRREVWDPGTALALPDGGVARVASWPLA